MSRIVSESLGAAVWRAGLADPQLHWKRGASAWELAISWESRRSSDSGLPVEVERTLNAHAAFRSPRLLVAIVEHSVVLDDPRRPSQSDLWGILLTEAGHVSMSVEGKAGEEFDRRLGMWLKDQSKGKVARLRFLCDQLAIPVQPADSLRYQLFHRAAAAVLEARRWRLPMALMLVQSLAESRTSWQDYADFAQLLDLKAQRQSVIGPRDACGVPLYLAWVDSPKAPDHVAASAV
ncbi:MAG: DUF6946 family protein [bacterium]